MQVRVRGAVFVARVAALTWLAVAAALVDDPLLKPSAADSSLRAEIDGLQDELTLMDAALQRYDSKSQGDMERYDGDHMVAVWFHGLRTANAPNGKNADKNAQRAWLKTVINTDPFLFAGHFAIASYNDQSAVCAPFGWGPTLNIIQSTGTGKAMAKAYDKDGAQSDGITGEEAIEQAKQHKKWDAALTDDTPHFVAACEHGAKVLFRTWKKQGGCQAPGMGNSKDQTKAGIQYGFPPIDADPEWEKTVFNCVTMPGNFKKAFGDNNVCEIGTYEHPCWSDSEFGQIRACQSSGEDWCALCGKTCNPALAKC